MANKAAEDNKKKTKKKKQKQKQKMEIARNIFHLHKNSLQLQALKMFAACLSPMGHRG